MLCVFEYCRMPLQRVIVGAGLAPARYSPNNLRPLYNHLFLGMLYEAPASY